MRNTGQRTLITLASVFVSLLLIAPITSVAQRPPDVTSGSAGGGAATDRRETTMTREADLQNRQIRLRLLTEAGRTANPPPSEEDRKQLVNQIFEDFERLQVANREMVQTSSNLNTAAYKRISSLADEMNKRAKRLKTNLGIPDLDDKKKDTEPALTIDAEQLKASVQALNISVKSFVTSPLFNDPRVTDVRHLQNLRRDILSVIDLSHTVKKAVKKLNDQGVRRNLGGRTPRRS